MHLKKNKRVKSVKGLIYIFGTSDCFATYKNQYYKPQPFDLAELCTVLGKMNFSISINTCPKA